MADETGPDDWQAEFLSTLGKELKKRKDAKEAMSAMRFATIAGHGIGKGALSAWLVLFFLTTRISPQIVATANTQIQLATKTWREVGKWHKMSVMKPWFKWTATKLTYIKEPEDWYAVAIPWSEENPEAFAGTHADTVIGIFDESSNIPRIIFETFMGALTDAEALIFLFGNPTRNTGYLFDCFNSQSHRWIKRQIDSRSVKRTNKAEIRHRYGRSKAFDD